MNVLREVGLMLLLMAFWCALGVLGLRTIELWAGALLGGLP